MALSQQQLNARRNFIGSSEASIIANGSYSSWYELIEQKRNSLEKIFDKQTRFLMEAGTCSDGAVAKRGLRSTPPTSGPVTRSQPYIHQLQSSSQHHLWKAQHQRASACLLERTFRFFRVDKAYGTS